jgi:uncharacterized protein YbjT (DUF2867 family)
VDFVIEAMVRLSTHPESRGCTYHLTDPDPLSPAAIARLFGTALGKRFAYLPVPLGLAKTVFRPLHRLFGLPVEALDYFDEPVRHDAALATRHLSAAGLTCPRLPDYVDRLVAYYRAERDRVRREAMI